MLRLLCLIGLHHWNYAGFVYGILGLLRPLRGGPMIRLLPAVLDPRPLVEVEQLVAAGVAALEEQHELLETLLARHWRDEFGHIHCPDCGGAITTAVPWASIQACTCALAVAS